METTNERKRKMKNLLMAICLLFASSVFAGDTNTKAITCEGRLKSGIFAIGGETTGTVLTTAEGVRYELDLGKDKDLAAQAEALNGKQVSVTGELQTRQGVETGARTVIMVTSLKAVDARKK
jgi:hypothetical protein